MSRDYAWLFHHNPPVKRGRREVRLDPSAADTELIFFVLDEPSDPARAVYDISLLAAEVLRSLVGLNGGDPEGNDTEPAGVS